MIWIDFLFILVFALILSSVLGWGFRWRHPAGPETAGASVLFLFFILFFTMWAIGAWLPPWGPVLGGSAWLGALFIGLLIALVLLAVATPSRPARQSPVEADVEAEGAAVASTVFGIFFWILLIGALIAIVVRYIT